MLGFLGTAEGAAIAAQYVDRLASLRGERSVPHRLAAGAALYVANKVFYSNIIRDVAMTGNPGSGVFDPNHKCLLGIISGKFTSHTTEGDKEIANYFVPA